MSCQTCGGAEHPECEPDRLRFQCLLCRLPIEFDDEDSEELEMHPWCIEPEDGARD